MSEPVAVMIKDHVDNYFALSPHGLTWLWDEATARAMQDNGLLTGNGLDGAVQIAWETIQHYIDMAWTGGQRVPDGYTRNP